MTTNDSRPLSLADLEAAFAGHRDVPLSSGGTLRLRALDLEEKQQLCERVQALAQDSEGNLTDQREMIAHALEIIGQMAVNHDGSEMFPEDDQGRRPVGVLHRLPLSDINAIVHAAHDLAGLGAAPEKKTG